MDLKLSSNRVEMSSNKKNSSKKNNAKETDDVERTLDTLWENWASRRKCETTHLPNFIDFKKKNRSD